MYSSMTHYSVRSPVTRPSVISSQRLEKSPTVAPNSYGRLRKNSVTQRYRIPIRSKPVKTQDDTDADYILPGLENVSDRHQPFWYRAVWALFLLANLVACLYQIGDRLYVYGLKEREFQTKVMVNSTISLPTITICAAPEIHANPELKEEFANENGRNACSVDWSELIGYKNLNDVYKVWDTLTTRDLITNISFPEAVQISPDETVVKRQTMPTLLGMCESLDLSENIIKYEYGHVTYFLIEFKDSNFSCDPTTVKVKIHSSEDSYRHTMYRESLDVFSGLHVSLLITSYTKIISMNRQESPCVDKDTYRECMDGCLDHLISEPLKCKLPFMRAELPYCTNAADAKKAYQRAETVYKNHADCSHCPKRCVEDKYTLMISPYSTGERNIEISVYYRQNVFQEATEVWAYDSFTCISDVGGNVGLFLGFCVIHVLELVDRLLFKAFNNIRSVVSRRFTNRVRQIKTPEKPQRQEK